MANRKTRTVSRQTTARKKSPRKGASRRGNPLGLLLAGAAALGLLYTACAPKVQEASRPALRAQDAPAPVAPPTAAPEPEPAASPPHLHVSEVPQKTGKRDKEEKREKKEEKHERREKREKREKRDKDRDEKREKRAEEPRRIAQVVRVTEEPAPDAPEAAAPESPAPQARPAPPPPAPPKAPRRPAAPSGEFAANPKATGEVAITFDASYDDAPLNRILQALEQRGYHATFFMTGIFMERYPAAVRRIGAAGMEMGNHSWSHPDFTKASDAEIRSQLQRTNERIEKLTGQKPALFRPPYGARNARVRRLVADEGYATIYWAVDSWDAVKKGITAREITQRVLSKVQPGDVVLMHIGSAASAEALPEILKGLDARGLRVVPVSELMAIS